MITVRVPASTSNLGSGFDTLGLALGLWLEVDVQQLAEPVEPGIEYEGEGAEALPQSRDNIVARSYELAAQFVGRIAPPAHFKVRNEIPIARGLGSSAAAAVAGARAFEAVSGESLPMETLLRLGKELEGHCDNFAASLLGGFVTVCDTSAGSTLAVRLDWPAELKAVLVIPNVPLSTSSARALLPDSVPRTDAIFNVQRVSLFQAAIASRRYSILDEAMRDSLHQPYRAAMLPGLAEVFALPRHPNTLGLALSGAGSAVIAFATEEHDEVGARIARCFASRGVQTEVRVLSIEPHGAEVVQPAK